MRLVLPVLGLVASALQASATASSKGNVAGVQVSPNGNAPSIEDISSSFSSHEFAAPHSKSPRGSRSITAFALIVPVVAVVFLILQCVVLLRRREDRLTTAQSRRLSSDGLDPCTPYGEGEDDLGLAVRMITGPNSRQRKQLAELQLRAQDEACLTDEEAALVRDAKLILEGNLKGIEELQEQLVSLAGIATDLRRKLELPPNRGGPETSTEKEKLKDLLQENRERRARARVELQSKIQHVNTKNWRETQQPQSLLLRAQYFLSGRMLTAPAAAALIARDVVLGTGKSADEAFQDAKEATLTLLLKRLTGDANECEKHLSEHAEGCRERSRASETIDPEKHDTRG
ncbi:hypothetical protein, conserved [Eimeria brunetti]|uniref:Transmembrane protein n=1 Tax=Eimeria brunetti TaxID=51314 RepID=U6LV86_9EIME|nr:hypothetical protein, conserved [Eimeria brunetti]